MNNCYVYVYWLDDVPFYIGKGSGRRSECHLRETEYSKGKTFMQNKIAKLVRTGRIDDVKVTFFIKDVDDETSKMWEKFLISAIGRRVANNGPLVNLSLGGDGAFGHRWTDENKANMRAVWQEPERQAKGRAALRIAWKDPKRKARMKEALREKWKDPEHRAKVAATKEADKRETIRRLQAGYIYWHSTTNNWRVRLFEIELGTYQTFVEAEAARIAACRAARDGKLDAFVEEVRRRGAKNRLEATMKTNAKRARAVRRNDGVVFPSIADAGRAHGANGFNISSVCKGVRKRAFGFTWEYVDGPLRRPWQHEYQPLEK
jgi:hypothetical protein